MEYNAQTGAILWQNQSDHTQQITAGYILANSATPQAVANGRTYGAPVPRPVGFQPGARPAGAAAGAGAAPQPGFGRQQGPADQIAINGGLAAQLDWFDNRGRLLERWPAHPLNGNPNFVRGDWYGNGKRTYFWFRFKLEPDGNAHALLQGRGLPHVRLRPHRSGPGDHAGGRGWWLPAGAVPRPCGFTATPALFPTRRRATPTAANSSPTTRTIENLLFGIEDTTGLPFRSREVERGTAIRACLFDTAFLLLSLIPDELPGCLLQAGCILQSCLTL